MTPDRPRVLLVDDEPDIIELLALMLPELQTETAQSADEALAKLKAGRFDALVTDIRLPGCSGAELLVQARAIAPELPVVVITGHYQAVTDQEKNLIHALVLKPFGRDDIRVAVFDALQHARR